MKVFLNNDFPDNIVTESENKTEIPIPVSTSEYKENEIYTSETAAAAETGIEAESKTSVFLTGSAADVTSQVTAVPNNGNSAQTQMPLQTAVQTTAQTDLQTIPITTDIQPPTTVCTVMQTENEGSDYMKKLASFFTSAIIIASSASPMIGNAEYKIDASRYWPGEKAIFDKMDSGELDLDVNGDGVFDLLDGYTMQLYFDHKIDPEYVFSDPKMKELYYSTMYQVVDQETINRIEAIADYNGDGKVNGTDQAHLVRYFIANQKLKIEYLDPTYYSPQSLCESHHETHGNWTSEELYVKTLIDNMDYLIAGYDIVAEMYENGTIDLDFNCNGQLDIGDVYVFYVYYNEDYGRGYDYDSEHKNFSDYMTAEGFNRCKNALANYPKGFMNLGFREDRFMDYVTLYIVGHIELKPEYFTEEYYQETFSPYYRPSFYIINYRVEAAAARLGLNPDEGAWLKYTEDEFYDFFNAYCNDVENGLRPAPDVNMDGVVDYYDYFASNIYLEDLLNNVTACPLP